MPSNDVCCWPQGTLPVVRPSSLGGDHGNDETNDDEQREDADRRCLERDNGNGECCQSTLERDNGNGERCQSTRGTELGRVDVREVLRTVCNMEPDFLGT